MLINSRQIVSGVFIFLLLTTCFGQDQSRDGRYFEGLARKAYQEKNYPSFLENMKRANELRPNHPRLMYSLAVAYALNGDKVEALAWLNKGAKMGLVFPVEDNHDLDTLKESPEFTALLKQLEQNKTPRVVSLTAFTVPEKGFIPESVAYDPVSDVFYLSSVYKRKILTVSKTGEAKVFSKDDDGLWSVLGMKVDSARRVLWICTTAHQQMSNYKAEDKGRSALIKYDLRTGKLIEKFEPADKSKPHFFGDLAINSEGDVFATDSITPAVYVVRHDKHELETLVEGDPFISPQGLDFTNNQKQLFVADYSKGILLVDLTSKKITSLTSDFAILGIDGLYFYKGSLIGVQNGVEPQRLVRLYVNKEMTRIDRFEIVEVNNPMFDEPTLGVLVKDNFYFVANSQWGKVDDSGKLAPDEKLQNPLVLKLRL